MKKIIALLLALVLVLSLAACGKDEPEVTTEPTTEPTTEATTEATTEPEAPDYSEAVLGAWAWNFPMDESYWAAYGMEGITGTVNIGMKLLLEDGAATIVMDPDTMDATCEELKAVLTDYTINALYATYEAQGMDAAAAEAATQEAFGMSVEEYAADSMSAFTNEDLAEIYLGVDEDPVAYSLDGDKLTIDGVDFTITVEDDTMTLLDCSDRSVTAIFGGMPAKLTRSTMPERTVIDSEVVGSWAWSEEAPKEELFGFGEGNFRMSMVMELTENGRMKFSVNTADKDFVNDLADLFKELFPQIMISMYASEDGDLEAAKALLEEELGMSLEEYVEAFMAELSDEDLLAAMNLNDAILTGTYTVEGDTLTLDGVTCSFTVEGSTLTLTAEDTTELADLFGEAPYTFTRVN